MPEALILALFVLLLAAAGLAWRAVGAQSTVVRVVALSAWSLFTLAIVAADVRSSRFRRLMADVPAGTKVESVPYRPESSGPGLTCDQARPRNGEATDWDKRALNVTWVDPVTGEQWTYAVEAGVVSCSVDMPSSAPPPGTFRFIVAYLAAAAAFIGALTRLSWRLLRALLRRRTAEGS